MWTRLAITALAAVAGLTACSSPSAPADAGPATPASSGSASTAPVAEAKPLPAPVREGGTLARTAAGDALILADEDHHALRAISLPLGATSKVQTTPLPGAPAQVLPLGDRVLVTVRALSDPPPSSNTGASPGSSAGASASPGASAGPSASASAAVPASPAPPKPPRPPGLLLVMKPDPSAPGGYAEAARVALPADAWGIAVTPDEKTALVSSSWTARISAIDVATATLKWTVPVAREPRGVVVRADGAAAYVTHLTGADLTRVDDLAGPPRVSRVDLPPSPARSPSGKKMNASLGYSAVLSPAGDRLFVARHALGVFGHQPWFGAATVDILLTSNDKPLSATHKGGTPPFSFSPTTFLPSYIAEAASGQSWLAWFQADAPFNNGSALVQPRAMAYRKSTRTLLVASEGGDVVVELDAEALDPSLAVVRTLSTGSAEDPFLRIPKECGAPSGLALAPDERSLWVHCRSTNDVVELDLAAEHPPPGTARKAILHVAGDPLPKIPAEGRRLFYNATNSVVSGGLGCAGCHPEGRDDGHVWHEAKMAIGYDGEAVNFFGSEHIVPFASSKGFPRRTPMLAGMVSAPGPYGWHAESESLRERIQAGFSLHRWADTDPKAGIPLVERIAQFLPAGLVRPPVEERPLTPQEERGKAIFTSEEARCAKCHVPETGYTDRMAYPFSKVPPMPGFDDEEERDVRRTEDPSAPSRSRDPALSGSRMFKTPGLRHVGGRPPYFHDGRAPTLETLIEKNGDRMGKTSHLSAEDQAALVAFLRSL